MISFILNDQVVTSELPPGTAVVDFIRVNNSLKGTKIGCREGDCGACSVLVGELKNGKMNYVSMTSCLMPLGNARGKHIVTIEGLNIESLTPVQAAFIKENGTQCGFCSPGFVVALIGFCMSQLELTIENGIEAVAGNICRCTGYKSIEKSIKIIIDQLGAIDKTNQVDWLIKNQFLPGYFKKIPEMITRLPKGELPDGGDEAVMIGGGTDLLLQDPDGAEESTLKLLLNSSKFKGIEVDGNVCKIGAATTTEELYQFPDLETVIPGGRRYIKLISSTPIRNMATVGGNVANGSPIGDLSAIFLALDATLTMSYKGQRRELPLREFFIGYKKINKESGELIESIHFTIPDANTRFNFEKISKRIHLDMATVNSALQVTVENKTITRAFLSIGGLGSTIISLKKTAAFLVGKKVDDNTVKEANKIAQSEVTPRSRAEYKRLLVRQLLAAHFLTLFPDVISLEAIR